MLIEFESPSDCTLDSPFFEFPWTFYFPFPIPVMSELVISKFQRFVSITNSYQEIKRVLINMP